jgi:hypothetical protein
LLARVDRDLFRGGGGRGEPAVHVARQRVVERVEHDAKGDQPRAGAAAAAARDRGVDEGDELRVAAPLLLVPLVAKDVASRSACAAGGRGLLLREGEGVDAGERVAVAAGEHGGAPGLLGVQEGEHVPEDAVGEVAQRSSGAPASMAASARARSIEFLPPIRTVFFLYYNYNETDLLLRDGNVYARLRGVQSAMSVEAEQVCDSSRKLVDLRRRAA